MFSSHGGHLTTVQTTNHNIHSQGQSMSLLWYLKISLLHTLWYCDITLCYHWNHADSNHSIYSQGQSMSLLWYQKISLLHTLWYCDITLCYHWNHADSNIVFIPKVSQWVYFDIWRYHYDIHCVIIGTTLTQTIVFILTVSKWVTIICEDLVM